MPERREQQIFRRKGGEGEGGDLPGTACRVVRLGGRAEGKARWKPSRVLANHRKLWDAKPEANACGSTQRSFGCTANRGKPRDAKPWGLKRGRAKPARLPDTLRPNIAKKGSMELKMLKKAMAVALSLVLCGSLVVPSFAAVELNKDEHIDKETGRLLKNSEDNYDYYLGKDVKLDKTLVIGAGVAANIDLNGHKLELNDTHSATVDSKGYLSGVTVKDTSVIEDETITWREHIEGPVIRVTGEGADLTVTDSSAIDEDGNYAVGKGTGAISGGYTGNSVSTTLTGGGGAGVHVDNGGSFTMKGGSITENYSNNLGGGIYANKGTVVLEGVSVTKNYARSSGGGIYAEDGSTVTLNNVDVSQNTAWKSAGGGIHIGSSYAGRADTTATITDSTIKKNQVSNSSNIDGQNGGGILVQSDGHLTLNNTEVVENKVPYGQGGGISGYGNVTINGGAVAGNVSKYGAGGINSSNVTTDGDVTVCSNTGKTGEETVHGSAAWDEGVVTKEATCEEAGVMTYTCKYCGETKTETIEKKGHTPGEAVRENVVDATCAAEGSYDEVVKCSECGETLSSTSKTLEKLDHTPDAAVRENVVDATCAAEGSYDEVVKCSECGETLSSTPKTIEKKDHTPGEAVRENEVAAQIGVAGSYDEVVYCSECGEEVSRDTVEIPALTAPATPNAPIVTPNVPDDPTIEIDEPDVPLAGLPIDLEAEDKLTRAQAVAVLHWMDSEPAAELATFLDVLADSDYAEAIGWAQASGIALGVGGNRFAPDEYVTRGQLITFLNRYAQYVGSDLVLEVEGDPNETLTWAEAEEIINDFFDRL